MSSQNMNPPFLNFQTVTNLNLPQHSPQSSMNFQIINNLKFLKDQKTINAYQPDPKPIEFNHFPKCIKFTIFKFQDSE